MGFLHKPVGRVTVEERVESFIVHAGYGYNDEGNRHINLVRVGGDLVVRESFCEWWREAGHPEFLYDDLDSLIVALTALRDGRESRHIGAVPRIMGYSAVVRVPAGVQPSTEEFIRADLVIVGDDVVKVRDRRIGKLQDVFSEQEIAHLPPEAGPSALPRGEFDG